MKSHKWSHTLEGVYYVHKCIECGVRFTSHCIMDDDYSQAAFGWDDCDDCKLKVIELVLTE